MRRQLSSHFCPGKVPPCTYCSICVISFLPRHPAGIYPLECLFHRYVGAPWVLGHSTFLVSDVPWQLEYCQQHTQLTLDPSNSRRWYISHIKLQSLRVNAKNSGWASWECSISIIEVFFRTFICDSLEIMRLTSSSSPFICICLLTASCIVLSTWICSSYVVI